ncbi:hypothetical protein RZS08_44020, partial [Arthrospira platensis SPKY1]|nr:hypothetical protein [Arthrospira platensis SPKY1]
GPAASGCGAGSAADCGHVQPGAACARAAKGQQRARQFAQQLVEGGNLLRRLVAACDRQEAVRQAGCRRSRSHVGLQGLVGPALEVGAVVDHGAEAGFGQDRHVGWRQLRGDIDLVGHGTYAE